MSAAAADAMDQILAPVVDNAHFGAGYFLLSLHAPGIAARVRPGQFLHLRVPGLDDRILRRPFSIFKAENDRLEILYKVVGRGTDVLSRVAPGDAVDIMAPLGTPFRIPVEEETPVLVAGGYGMAALYILAQRAQRPGIVCAGARTASDILAANEFRALGYRIEITTEDGSLGSRGMVTDALERLLDEMPPRPVLYACGPDPMLRRVAEIAAARSLPAQVSLDPHLGCGLGACLTCVVRIRTGPDTWDYRRACREGPVFDAHTVLWDP